uniref:Heat shock factor binding protein 1 like 1 n=1 Tax=Maylandia zebra TaxID=106582 RepID=A0A3P9AU32_9CICH
QANICVRTSFLLSSQRFQSISEQLVCFLMLTLDQMGTRINDLERNVTELMTQADTSSVQ